MKSILKLYTASFKYLSGYSKDTLEESIDRLYDLTSYVHKIDNIYVDYSIYEQDIFNGIKLIDILYCSELQIERDLKSRLEGIFERNIINEESDIVADAYIIFYPVANVDGEIYIQNIPEWCLFKRKVLEDNDISGADFIDLAFYIFPQLYFHDENKKTINKILMRYKKKIITALSILNDHLHECTEKSSTPKEITDKLNAFLPQGIDSSPESSASRRDLCTFNFSNEKKESENICCELHIKIHSDDMERKPTRNQPYARIYFHQGKNNIQNEKILIGHIGDHL